MESFADKFKARLKEIRAEHTPRPLYEGVKLTAKTYTVYAVLRGDKKIIAIGVTEPEANNVIECAKRRLIKLQEPDDSGSPYYEATSFIKEEQK